MGGRSRSEPGGPERRWWIRAPLGVVVLAAVLRLWMPGPAMLTVDELLWQVRSDRFATALAEQDFASANVGPADQPATRPGVTTMWIGLVGADLAEADPFGIGAGRLRWTHALMGLATSLMVWPFVVLTARLVGRRAALIAGVVVAVEPLLVGHSAIQHTDALGTMTFGVAAVALISAFEASRRDEGEAPRVVWARPAARLAAVSGVFAALGCLTKVSAVPLVGAMGMTVLAVHLAGRRDEIRSRLRQATGILGPAAATFVLTALVLWPALWVDPLANLQSSLDSKDLASGPSPHMFLGSIREGGDWRYYPVEVWFRASPWLLLGGLAATACTLWRRVRRAPRWVPRRIAYPLIAPAITYGALISVSEKQYARYILPMLPLAAIGLGVAAAALAGALPRSSWARPLGWTACAAASVFTLSLAPYAISFVDPLVGGQRQAERAIPLGWGEGKEAVIQGYLDRTDECEPWSTVGSWLLPCETQDFGWLDGSAPPPRFVALYVFDRQLNLEPDGLRAYLADHGRLVEVVTIDGVDYAELWELTEPSRRARPRVAAASPLAGRVASLPS